MKKLFLIFFVLPLFVSAQDRPELAVSKIPSELVKGSNAVVRNESLFFDVSAPGRAIEYMTHVVTIFNANTYSNQLVIFYDEANRLGKIKGKVYDAGGKFIREIKKDEIRDQSYSSGGTDVSDTRVRYIEINESSYPYTIVFEYKKVHKDILTYPDWRIWEYGLAVQKSTFKVSVPDNITLKYEVNKIEPEYDFMATGDKNIYTWKIENVLPVKSEPYSPGKWELCPYLRVSSSKFEAEGYSGSMSDWKSFGDFFNVLGEGRDELPNEVKADIKNIVAGVESRNEKIALLYKYMQENTRYVSVQLGIGGWQPFSAKYVSENKYGDCKALSNYMKAMLKEVGIKSYPVLIYRDSDKPYEISEEFTCDAFNHVILYVPEEDMWLECTSNNDPPGYLDMSTQGRNVLLVTEEGGKIARTPELKVEENLKENNLTILLEADGSAKMEMNSSLRGIRQDNIRFLNFHISEKELKDRLRQSISLSSFEFTNFSVEPDLSRPETKLNYEASVKRFASKAGKRLFIPMNPINPYDNVPSEQTERIHPVVKKYGYTETDKIIFALPEGYTVESMPNEPIEIKSEQTEYYCKVTADNTTVTVERKLIVHPFKMPAESYEEWRDTLKKISKADATKLVLVKKT